MILKQQNNYYFSEEQHWQDEWRENPGKKYEKEMAREAGRKAEGCEGI